MGIRFYLFGFGDEHLSWPLAETAATPRAGSAAGRSGGIVLLTCGKLVTCVEYSQKVPGSLSSWFALRFDGF